MTTKDIRLNIMLYSPALFNGKEFETVVELRQKKMFRTDAETASLLQLTPGATASVRGRIIYEDYDSTHDYINVYISDEKLIEFIEKHGTSDINTRMKIKAEFIYKVYDVFDLEKIKKVSSEIIGCRLLDIISDEHLDEDII